MQEAHGGEGGGVRHAVHAVDELGPEGRLHAWPALQGIVRICFYYYKGWPSNSTRDYTPFLLRLQGMTLQLQGIARLSFYYYKG